MSRKVLPQAWDNVRDAQSAELERRIQAEQAQALQRSVDEKTLRNINRIVIEILKANHNEHGDAILAQSVLENRLRARMREEMPMFDEDKDFCRLNEPDVLKLFRRTNSGVTVLQDGQVVPHQMEMLRRDGLAFRYETKFSIHSTDDLDRVLQDHAFVLDKDRPVEARGLTHAELFDTNKEQQEIRKQHVEELLRTGRVLRCSAASHISEASAEGRKDSAKRANDQDMIYYWVPSEYQVDLSDKSFEHRLGEVRKLWRQITDPTPAGMCHEAWTGGHHSLKVKMQECQPPIPVSQVQYPLQPEAIKGKRKRA